ncbi:hypothetical protein [Microbacterium tumbae]
MIVGLLLPGGDDAPSGAAQAASTEQRVVPARPDVDDASAVDAGDGETGTTEGDRAPAPRSRPTTPSTTDGPDDPVVATEALLRALSACADQGDPECPTALAEGANADPEAILGASGTVAPVLVDDYGDIAVVRIGGDGAKSGEQMLVLIRQDGKWLVRDAYDVADQPDR